MRTLRAVLLVPVLLAVVGSGTVANASSGPDPALRQWPSWPFPVGCGSAARPFDPIAVFGGSADALQGTDPPSTALREFIGAPPPGVLGVPQADWREAGVDATHAEFIGGSLAGQLSVLSTELVAGVWKPAGFGNCVLSSVRDGSLANGWKLAQDQNLRASTKKVKVILGGPDACNDGKPLNPRAQRPVFRQIGRKLLITIWLDPVPPGPHQCQGVVEIPLVVRLPGRLGRRTIWNGGTYPPVEMESFSRSARLPQ